MKTAGAFPVLESVEAPEEVGLDPEALRRLSGHIEADIRQGRLFGASFIVARGGFIGLHQAVGEAAPGRAAAEDDIYLLMSLAKAFVATLVLRSIDRGQFELDTAVADILPEFGAGGKQQVTVRQLLTHTAGTYAGFLPPPPLNPADAGDLGKNFAAVAALPAANLPGSRCVYNPFGSYAVLGQLLVATDPSQRRFGQIARDELFEPAGMVDTSYGQAIDSPRRVAVGFTEANTSPTTPQLARFLNSLDGSAELPAGGAFGTARDVFRFAEILRRGGGDGGSRLLSRAMFDYAAQNHTGSMSNGFWDFEKAALGIPDFPANFTLLGGYVRGQGHHFTPLGHTASPGSFGAVGGGSTFWMVDPERDLTFVFLSAGFIEGLRHLRRTRVLADLALAAAI